MYEPLFDDLHPKVRQEEFGAQLRVQCSLQEHLKYVPLSLDERKKPELMGVKKGA